MRKRSSFTGVKSAPRQRLDWLRTVKEHPREASRRISLTSTQMVLCGVMQGALIFSCVAIPVRHMAPVDASATAAWGSIEVRSDRKRPGLRISETLTAPGERVVFRGRSGRTRNARVSLQMRKGERWKTVKLARTRHGGRFRIRLRMPATSQPRVKFRVVADGVRRGSGARAIAGPLAVKVRPQSIEVAGPITWLVGQTIAPRSVSLSPARRGRPVWLERYQDGAWQRVGSTRSKSHGDGTAVVSPAPEGMSGWMRIRAAPWNGMPGVASSLLQATLPSVKVIAHRGGGGEAPESTLLAVRQSLEAGADVIEGDVQMTSDGHLVMMHDASLARTTNVEQVFPWRSDFSVQDFTLEEIRQLDAGLWLSERYRGVGVPTLDEWLTTIGNSASVELELKTPRSWKWGNGPLLSALNGELGRALIESRRLTLTSFDVQWLRVLTVALPGVRYAAIHGHRPNLNELHELATYVQAVIVPAAVVDPTLVEEAVSAGLQTELYTPNSPEDLTSATHWGPYGVITDYPTRLVALLSPSIPMVSGK